ncbi:hypothetical protein PbDSM24746_39980 [Paenibacillus macerans]|nr:hypothetical protein PbDSM24746_39980 [Paenibacillus macerans]GBK70308.1 hypothetical protein PbJCM17693_40160 [Paenibacillus macerans]
MVAPTDGWSCHSWSVLPTVAPTDGWSCQRFLLPKVDSATVAPADSWLAVSGSRLSNADFWAGPGFLSIPSAK